MSFDAQNRTYSMSRLPRLVGGGGAYYDAAAQRWIPSERQTISPDRAQYVWTRWDQTTNPANPPTSTLHIVDVATGHHRSMILRDFPLVPVIMDFDGSRVYLDSGYEGPPSGLWTFDLNSSTLTQIASVRYVEAVTAATGVAWLGGVDPSDPNPPQEIEGGSSDELIRWTIANGDKEQWFYAPGLEVYTIGFDAAGRPIIAAGGDLRSLPNPRASFRLITGRGQSTEIASGPQQMLEQAKGDSHGLWFTGGGGLYFYQASKGLARVWAGRVRTIAGPCT